MELTDSQEFSLENGKAWMSLSPLLAFFERYPSLKRYNVAFSWNPVCSQLSWTQLLHSPALCSIPHVKALDDPGWHSNVSGDLDHINLRCFWHQYALYCYLHYIAISLLLLLLKSFWVKSWEKVAQWAYTISPGTWVWVQPEVVSQSFPITLCSSFPVTLYCPVMIKAKKDL